MSKEEVQSFPCFFHHFKIPTSGNLIIDSKGVHFKGIHLNGDSLEKTFLYNEIFSIKKESFMMRYYTCIDCLGEKHYFSGFTQTEGISQDKVIEIVEPRIKDTKHEIVKDLIKIKESGIETLKILKQDQETLEKSKETLNDIDYNISLTDRLMTGFYSWSGSVKNFFTMYPELKKEEIKNETNETKKEKQEIEAMSSLLEDIKNISLDMNSALDQSNQTLSKMNQQVDSTKKNIIKTNQKISDVNNKIL